jgi:hypothetical protein
MSSLSTWFHGGGQEPAEQPARQHSGIQQQQPLLPRSEEEEDFDSVTTIMSGRSGNPLRRSMLVRLWPCCPSHPLRLITPSLMYGLVPGMPACTHAGGWAPARTAWPLKRARPESSAL